MLRLQACSHILSQGLVVLLLGNLSQCQHLAQYKLLSCFRILIVNGNKFLTKNFYLSNLKMLRRVKILRLHPVIRLKLGCAFYYTCKHCRFCNSKILDILREICPRCLLNSVCILTKVIPVKICLKYLVLG